MYSGTFYFDRKPFRKKTMKILKKRLDSVDELRNGDIDFTAARIPDLNLALLELAQCPDMNDVVMSVELTNGDSLIMKCADGEWQILDTRDPDNPDEEMEVFEPNMLLIVFDDASYMYYKTYKRTIDEAVNEMNELCVMDNCEISSYTLIDRDGETLDEIIFYE